MSIYTKPKYNKDILTGITGKPTTKIFVKLPHNQIYISLLSAYRILHEPNQHWYAFPLFENKRRRLGNIKGIYGASMNHGQIPGFYLYKLYTKEEILKNKSYQKMIEIKNNIYGKEEENEYLNLDKIELIPLKYIKKFVKSLYNKLL